jgi:antitoxin component of RelBE/YafQ-DinJ toxin-antitoxin module
MQKTAVVNVRVDPEVKAALEDAARADGRTVSNYVERILVRHLVDHGLIPERGVVKH